MNFSSGGHRHAVSERLSGDGLRAGAAHGALPLPHAPPQGGHVLPCAPQVTGRLGWPQHCRL